MSPVLLIILVVLVGSLVAARILGHGDQPRHVTWADALAFGPGIGLGLLSIGYVASLAMGWHRSTGTICVSSALAILLVSAMTILSGTKDRAQHPHKRDRLSRRVVAGTILGVLGLIVLLLVFYAWRELRPQGSFDAMAIWNVRARMLFHFEGDDWAALFDSMRLGHPDYPLLLPGCIAAQWSILGRDAPEVPRLVALTFSLGLALMVWRAVARLTRPAWGPFAVLLLLAAPNVGLVGQYQNADIPLAYFLLGATIGLASLQGSSRAMAWPPLLAGIFAGLLPWIKNEGIPLAIILALCLGLSLIPRKWRDRPWRQDLPAFLVGAIPGLATVCLFKLHWSPVNDLTRDVGGVFRDNITDISRWATVAGGYWKEVTWGAHWGITWLVIALGMAMFLRKRAFRCGITRWMTAVLLAGNVAWFMVYVLTPRPLKWHLDTSLYRLMLHLYPIAVVWVFCLAASSRKGSSRNESSGSTA